MMRTMTDPHEIADRYGVQYEGTLVGPEYHDTVDYHDQMTLADVAAAGGKVTRLRILADRDGRGGRGDISYCHATLPDGKVVPVVLDHGIGIPMRNLNGYLIEWAKREGVFAKGVGLLDKGNRSIMWG